MTRGADRPNRACGGETGGILTIDLDALAANWRLLQNRMEGKPCAAVVKADGYGVGVVPVARRLAAEGCETFFVAHIEEGVTLRQALPGPEIFVLNGLLPGGAPSYGAHQLAPCLNDIGQVRAWLDHCGDTGPTAAALHVDTGMTRLGLDPDDLETIDLDGLRALPNLIVMSHLACADEPDHPLNERQRAAFEDLRMAFPAARASLANSSGLFMGDGYRFDLGRPGVALYGGNPMPTRGHNPMRPVVRLQARVLQVREIQDSRSIGYGATADAFPGTRIATLAAGYADGYLRAISNRGTAYVDGHACPVVGRVSMDLLTIDVTKAIADGLAITSGALVDLINKDHTVDDVAADAGTIGYEILTSLGNRFHRRYVGESGA